MTVFFWMFVSATVFWAVAQPMILVMGLQIGHVLLARGGDGLIYGVDGMYFFLLGVVLMRSAGCVDTFSIR